MNNKKKRKKFPNNWEPLTSLSISDSFISNSLLKQSNAMCITESLLSLLLINTYSRCLCFLWYKAYWHWATFANNLFLLILVGLNSVIMLQMLEHPYFAFLSPSNRLSYSIWKSVPLEENVVLELILIEILLYLW